MNTNRCISNHSTPTQYYKCWYRLSTHYKGGMDGWPAVEQLVAIRRRPLISDDSRTVFSVGNSSIDDTTPSAIVVVPHFTSRIGNGPVHQRCCAVVSLPTLTTTSSFYRRDSAPPGR